MTSFDRLRPLLAPWGRLQPQPASDWQGPFALPAIVEAFYREVGPWGETWHASVGPVGLTINAGGNPVDVPPLHKLWARQDGYAWSRNPDNPIAGWPAHWLVVAQEGANPFILDRNDGSVWFDLAGGGNYDDPSRFADDLPTALGAIATVANALAALGDDALDDTYELKPESRVQVSRALAAFTGSAASAEDMLKAWRWYL